MGFEVEPQNRHSLEAYFRMAEASEEKLEYHEGRIVSMAGGTGEHSLIIANANAAIHGLVKGSNCRVYDSNLRVKVSQSARYVYPDISVICGSIQYDPTDKSRQTASNPKLIVEVLSPSTEGYDRGEKFKHYLRIPTFEEYVLVSQRHPYVEVFSRQSDGSWSFRLAEGTEQTARLRSLDVDLPLADVFAGVEFPPDEDARLDARESE